VTRVEKSGKVKDPLGKLKKGPQMTWKNQSIPRGSRKMSPITEDG